MARTTPPTIVSAAGTNRHLVWGREIQRGKGNIGFADGSVKAFASGAALRAASGTGIGTNRPWLFHETYNGKLSVEGLVTLVLVRSPGGAASA
jgi:prepilin-type processing-associated H-X9-DG protein